MYIVGMFTQFIYDGRSTITPGQLVADDPSLLEDEIWRFFEVEGRLRGHSLTACGTAWAVLLHQLSRDGIISRDRLLDVTLDALTRDFSTHNAKWFQEFHNRLGPDLDEQEARLDRYLHLLGSQVSPTVRLALDVLEHLAAAGRLPARRYCASGELAMSSGPKVTARAALELLERVLDGEPSARADGASCAVAALGHTRVDVQSRAIDLLTRTVDPGDVEVRAAMLVAGAGVATSLRARLEALVGLEMGVAAGSGDEAQQDEERALRERAGALAPELRRLAGVDDALAAVEGRRRPPPLSFLRHEIPVVHPGNAIRPIGDLAELVELLTTLVESVNSGRRDRTGLGWCLAAV
jgi:hypothetical protein